MVLLEFFSDIIFSVALWPWGRLSLQQKWVPGVFPGGKGGRCVGLTTLPPSSAVVMKYGKTLTSWNPLGHFRPVMGLLYLYFNFLEPSGPLQACNGTALPFYVFYKWHRLFTFYIGHYNISECKKRPLRVLLYIPVYVLCIDMPKDGLNIGRNM